MKRIDATAESSHCTSGPDRGISAGTGPTGGAGQNAGIMQADRIRGVQEAMPLCREKEGVPLIKLLLFFGPERI